MAKETIEAIRMAEQETGEQEKEARRKAEELISKASADARELVKAAIAEETRQGAQKENDEHLKETALLAEQQSRTEEEIARLKKDTETKMPDAVRAVLKTLTE